LLNHGITAAATESCGLGSGISEFIDDYVFPRTVLSHRPVARSLQHVLEASTPEKTAPHDGTTLGTGHPLSSMPQAAPDREQNIPALAIYSGSPTPSPLAL